MSVFARHGPAQTVARAATLRWTLLIKLAIPSGHSKLTPGQPVPAQNLQIHAPGRVATGALIISHFEGLLGQPPGVDNQPITRVFRALLIKTGDFTMTELWEAIKSTQGNRATGLDCIPSEVCFNDQLLEVCSRAYHGDIPDMWLKGAILPFPRRGNLGSASNYSRAITLMALGAKICSRMLLDRLRPHIDPKLKNNQNDCRKGRSTVAQILTLRRLVEGIKSTPPPPPPPRPQAIITFVDFRKAFNSIHRGKLIEFLWAYGVLVEIVDAVNMMYTNTTTQVLSLTEILNSLKF